MIVHFVLTYDRLTEKDPLVSIINTLLKAEASNLTPVLGSTINFTLEITHGDQELHWILDKVIEELEMISYAKIYNYGINKGKGKIFNPNMSSRKNNSYIGDSFVEALRIAEIDVKSFRKQYVH